MLSVPQREGRARLLVLRLLVRLCHFRGRHRSLLGAQPRAGIPQRARAASLPQGRDARARSGRDRRRLGVHVFASTPPTAASPNCARCRTGICDTNSPPWRRGRSRLRRRVREAIPGHGGPDEAARLQPLDFRSEHGHQAQQRRSRAGARSSWPKRNSSCACAATSQSLDDLRKVAVGVGDERRADPARAGRQRATRPGHAARHRRAERRGRNRRRHRRRALRRERAAGHSAT